MIKGVMGRLGVGAIAVVLVAVGACGDDDDDGGPRGQAGHAAEAGQAGADAGGGGASAAAGASHAGDAGHGGGELGGAGGDAGRTGHGGGGAGGRGEPPPVKGEDCEGNAIELDPRRVQQCVLLASCAPIELTSDCVVDGIDGFSFHFYKNADPVIPYQFDGRIERCFGSLESCDDVLACAGVRYPIGECEADETSRCDGELAINCGDHPSVKNCETLSGEKGACRVFGEGAAAHAECVVTDECEVASATSQCAGDVLQRCDEPGFGFGIDCGALGLSCRQYARGASCVAALPEESCAEPGVAACDGSVLRYCGEGGVAFARDCAAIGDLECVQGAGDTSSDEPWFDCSPRACDIRFEVQDICDGDDLLLDVGEAHAGLRLHCPDYGFATCRAGRCAN